MNLEKILVYGGLGYLAYRLIQSRNQPQQGPGVTLIPPPEDKGVGEGGEYYFRYVGSSALRTNFDGSPIDCGMSGEPFSDAGVERQFATTGSAPTTYFAMLEIGTRDSIYEGRRLPNSNLGQDSIKVGDKLQIEMKGGQFSAMDGQVVTVLQLGSDSCTTSGRPEMMNSAVVVDFPIILQGAQDYQYPAMDGIGCFKRIGGGGIDTMPLSPGHLL